MRVVSYPRGSRRFVRLSTWIEGPPTFRRAIARRSLIGRSCSLIATGSERSHIPKAPRRLQLRYGGGQTQVCWRPVEAVAFGPRASVAGLASAVRPADWIKNLLVFAPLLFSGEFDETGDVARSAVMFAALCAMASAGYLLNDVKDVRFDRAHAQKSRRAIASGALSVRTALLTSAALAILALLLAGTLGADAAGLLAGYAGLVVLYSAVLKQLVIIDVMALAAFFVLRVVGGSVAIDVEPSEWLVFCTGMLALFLGFCKRRQETTADETSGSSGRPVLEHYSLPFLDQIIPLVTAATLVSYAIYAMESPLAGKEMLYTTPAVVYGLLRYLYLIYQVNDPRGTAVLLTRDPGMVSAVVVWAASAGVVLYL
jgi:4-hydroxybenzoate polyprenyltransferase